MELMSSIPMSGPAWDLKKRVKLEKMLIRIPMLSEVDRVLDWADISLNSE
ncbi:unnamed protein product, partial [marine sediment metagenome]